MPPRLPALPLLRPSALIRKPIPRLPNRYISTHPTHPMQPRPPADPTLLESQRLKRPIAPHLSIYKPQLTWVLSALNRVTGLTLSGGIYLFGLSYVAAPFLGWHLDSASIAAWFGGLGVATKVLAKTFVAGPFMYHTFNSMRHQVWDTGRALSLPNVYRGAYAVLFLTAVGTGWAVFGV